MKNETPTSDMMAHDKVYNQHQERKASNPPPQAPMRGPDITIGGPASLPSKEEVDEMRRQNPETPLTTGADRTTNSI